MLVFDRWGQMIFISHQLDYGWDGRVNGRYAPQGTYFYTIKYINIEGQPGTVKGSVLLLR